MYFYKGFNYHKETNLNDLKFCPPIITFLQREEKKF
jgi:hypothetical protein